jgi:hypothetical protein
MSRTGRGSRLPIENVMGDFCRESYVADMADKRRLRDLVSVGKAIEQDFHLLGVFEVKQLAACNADELFGRLQQLTGCRQDPCVLDTFNAAIAQAKDPNLPDEQCRWWYWSRLRKNRQK